MWATTSHSINFWCSNTSLFVLARYKCAKCINNLLALTCQMHETHSKPANFIINSVYMMIWHCYTLCGTVQGITLVFWYVVPWYMSKTGNCSTAHSSFISMCTKKFVKFKWKISLFHKFIKIYHRENNPAYGS